MKRDLLFVQEYPHPIERVWAAVSDSAAIAAWLMPNDFQPAVGHKFQFRSKPQGGWNGIVDCEVLKVEPPRELAYSWKGDVLDTVLTIRLEAAGEGTRLTLEHKGFRGAKGLLIATMMGNGWKGIVSKGIPAVLERLAQGEVLPSQAECAH